MDLDLNLEPVQDQAQIQSRVGGEEDSEGRIQERIRLLESVVSRGRYRRPPLPSSSTTETAANNVLASINPYKIDGGTHLLAKALAMDSCSEQNEPSTSTSTSPSPSPFPRKPGGSDFDCNMCFSLSKDPVLTCCGHLFCWPCFHRLPNSDSYYTKECPVCQGEVLETDVIPIYGGGNGGSSVPYTSSSSIDPHAIKIPPRPRARRIDSTRSRLRAHQVFGVHPSWLPLATSVAIPPRPSPPVTDGIDVVL